jgi:site-specific DNA recombinase
MADTNPTPKIAAVYIRVSTREQERGWSPDIQRQACIQVAQELEYDVPREYIFDEGISGDFWQRSAFTRLRQCVKERLVSAVFMQYSDRISRKAWQQLRFLEECQQSGVSLYIGNQPVDDSRSGRLLFGIRSNLDEDAKALLLERTKQGKEQRARAGLPPGGQVPFGYEVIYSTPRRSAWVINEAESKVVKDIYHWYLDGLSMLNIAKCLSTARIDTKTQSKSWSSSTVRGILENEAYTGRSYHRRVQIVERSLVVTDDGRERVKSKRAKRAKDEMIPFDVPAIISREIYEAAQVQRQRNIDLAKRNMRYEYLLRPPWLRCACGQGMSGVTMRRKFRYYRCASAQGLIRPRCPGMLRADDAERQVWRAVEDILMSPQQLSTFIQQQQQASGQERQRLQQDIEGYKVSLSGCDEEWARMMEAYAAKIVSIHDLDTYRTKLDKRREDLRQQIQQCQDRLNTLQVTSLQIHTLVSYVSRVRNNQLVAATTEAAAQYPMIDMEPQLVDTIVSTSEAWEKRGQRFYQHMSTMLSEQRQQVETRWQVRERLRSMTIADKQHLFDALGLQAIWTRKQPLSINLAVPYEDENGASANAARYIQAVSPAAEGSWPPLQG